MNNLLAIGAAARAVDRSEGTLRTWERNGLVTPLRDSLGRRLYTERDIDKMREIAQRKRKAVARG